MKDGSEAQRKNIRTISVEVKLKRTRFSGCMIRVDMEKITIQLYDNREDKSKDRNRVGY